MLSSSRFTYFTFISTFIAYLSCTTSCYKTAIFDVQTTKQLSVNCILTNDSPPKVEVTTTLNPNDSLRFIPIKDANVSISDGQQVIVLDSFINPGIFSDLGYYTTKKSSNFPLFLEKRYTLAVSANNLTEIKSQTILPDTLNITNIELSNIIIKPQEIYGNLVIYPFNANLKIKIQDKFSEKNYYLIRALYVSDYFLDYKTGKEIVIDTLISKKTPTILQNINGIINTNLIGTGLVFTDQDFNGQNKELDVLLNSYLELKTQIPSTITIELLTINEDCYKYILTYPKQVGLSQDPFSEPVNIYSNIENGLGIFGGYGIVRRTLQLQ
jgi:Domain of unknown function (DUF4249)